MFKVHLKFASHNMWIRLSEILKVYRMDTEDYTVISFKNAVHVYVTESVEEILEAIKQDSCSGRLYTTDGRILEV